jgi:hypothetical protein
MGDPQVRRRESTVVSREGQAVAGGQLWTIRSRRGSLRLGQRVRIDEANTNASLRLYDRATAIAEARTVR